MQVLVLTGCASGIGQHLTRALCTQYRIVATDVRAEQLAEIARADQWPDSVVKLALDVRDPASWERTLADVLQRCGRVDTLVNNAGVLHAGAFVDAKAADIDFHLDVNAKGVMHGCRVFGRQFVTQGHGHLINIGSLASLAPVPGLALYAASKFAVRGFSLALAQELRPAGVAVTVVMPDAVETPMLVQQEGVEEAALTFSGSRTLTVEDVERAFINHVLPERPLEVTIPMGRGLLARLANVVPSAVFTLGPLLRARGRAEQARRTRKN
jgi:3-oxoacyl-[acyl-carrier protein] reductase